eukprot:m.180325 g.180325  ORF g.180325 m.180325 type:complete len:312 (-) comp13575_c0_seq1:689-1624(-)
MFDPKPSQFNLAASASLLPNNLTVFNANDSTTTLFYIHKSAVWQTSITKGGKDEIHRQFCLLDGVSSVHQIKVVEAEDETVLVVAGDHYVQFYSLEGEQVAQHVCDEADSFFNGVDGGKGMIVAGCSTGDVFVFSPKDYTVQTKKTVSEAPITQLCVVKNNVVVADESGCICVVDADLNLLTKLIEGATDVPCLSMCASTSRLYCGFDNGMLHIYNVNDWTKMCAFSGHGRSIFALCSIKDNLISSVGLDSKAQVWHIGADKTAKDKIRISLVFTATIKDRMLVGVQPLADSSLMLACFDSYKVVKFVQKK